ncbi:3-methyl-2-oxobutanoate hydroxymethyltransferase [Sulfurimonas sp.]|uniref:3-methyl-2-oxobutanoate hydroxymethyltransferase n=1 Tax=Sulfurimonas sp. TaxID=2022749 RepID=UPI002623DCA9|nr:3-methyl-2-oxobutanoate hydroxymethyltransferase [Sulfurimonas sp.]
MSKKLTISSIKQAKGVKSLVMITAYDALFSQLVSESADMILVGDSLNMSFAGKSDTISATLDQMIYHTNAVCLGAPNNFVICDMPFGTYINKDRALDNAIKVFQQTKADCVKIEGGQDKADVIAHLTANGIAVCGHIGLLPQSVRSEGGYKVKGKTEEQRASIIADAKAVEKAGAFCMVIEGTKADVAKEVAEAVSIPVIGIGAGADVDGQVLVFSDMLGLFEAFTPKFVKKYLDGATLVKNAVKEYADEVATKAFPAEEHTY